MRMLSRKVHTPGWLGGVAAFVVMASVGLSGCGSAEPDPTAAGPSSSGKPKVSAGNRPDMVAAVSASKTPGAVDVRFALSGRPTVGQPLEVQVALTPTQELDALYARFDASDGLELVKGVETPHLKEPATGSALEHSVTVVPRSDGIFNLTAVVLSDSPKESVTRYFSIPIIAGAGLPDLPADTKEPGPPSASGRP
jgi:hypothetical protein